MTVDWYDVKATGGASMDGTTDDTSAISAGISAIGNATNGVLYFKDGVCYINGTVTIPHYITMKFDRCSLSLGPSANLTIRSPEPVNVAWFGTNGSTFTTTGSITTGTDSLTVASAANLKEGNMLMIEGAGAAAADLYARAITISGTTVTLDTDASTTVSSNDVRPADNKAFEQALDCHPTASWAGYQLYVPHGNYRFMAGVTLPNSTSVFGDGRLTSIITQDATYGSGHIFSMGGGCDVRNLKLVANASGNCVTNSGTVNDNLFTNIWFYGNFATTALMTGIHHNTTIDNCAFEAAERAIDLGGNNHLTLAGCIFYDITVTNIRSTSGGQGINISNCHFEVQNVDASDEYIINLASYEDVSLSNVNIKRTSTENYATALRFHTCKNLNFSNVTLHDAATGAGGYAVRLDTCDNVSGTLTVWGENVQPAEAIVIDDTNDFDLSVQVNGATTSFVSLYGTCSNGRVHIIGRDCDSYGIYLSGTLADITFSGVIEDTGNVTAASPCVQMGATGRVVLSDMVLKRASGKSTNWFECATAGELRFRRTELVYG